jgi:hypothetical protein
MIGGAWREAPKLKSSDHDSDRLLVFVVVFVSCSKLRRKVGIRSARLHRLGNGSSSRVDSKLMQRLKLLDSHRVFHII